jgi:PAS domain S-box-containing protein
MIWDNTPIFASRPIASEPRAGLWKQKLKRTIERTQTKAQALGPQQFLSVIENVTDIVITFDMKGFVLYCNPAARSALAMGDAQRKAPLQISDIFPRRVHEHILGGGILTAILDGIWSGETTLLGRNGQEIPVSQVIVAPLGPDGRCERLTIIARDITLSKRAEEELRKSAKFYRDIVQTAPVGIWIIDDDNRTGFVNSKMATILGYKPTEMTGMHATAILDDPPAHLVERPVLLGDTSDSGAVRLRCKNGKRVWLNLSTSSLFDEQEQFAGTLVVATELNDTQEWQGQALLWSGITQNARLPA